MPVAGGFFYPSLGVELSYNDNVALTSSKEVGSYAAIVSPKGRFEFQGDASQVSVDLGLNRGTYLSSHADDYLDANASVQAAYYPTERVSMSGGLAFDRGHEARGTGGAAGITTSAPDEYDMWTLSGAFKYGVDALNAPRFELELSHADQEYLNNRATTQFQDKQIDRLKGTLFYRIMPNTSLLVEAGLTSFNYDRSTTPTSNLDSDETRILVGLTWDATYQTQGIFKLGKNSKNFDVPSKQDADTTVWELGVNWSPLSYSKFNLSTNRSFAESDGAAGDYTTSSTTSLTWMHDWTSYFGTNVSLSYLNEQYGNSTREDDTTTFSLTADYRVQPWLVLSGGFTRAERNSNRALTDYVNNIIGIQVGIGM